VICFPDTSVVFKLAGFDLVHEALSVLSVAPQDLFILQETRNMCKGNARAYMQEQYGRQAIPRVESLIQMAGRKSSRVDDFDQLSSLLETAMTLFWSGCAGMLASSTQAFCTIRAPRMPGAGGSPLPGYRPGSHDWDRVGR